MAKAAKKAAKNTKAPEPETEQLRHTETQEMRTEKEILAELEDWEKYKISGDISKIHALWVDSKIDVLRWVLGLKETIV